MRWMRCLYKSVHAYKDEHYLFFSFYKSKSWETTLWNKRKRRELSYGDVSLFSELLPSYLSKSCIYRHSLYIFPCFSVSLKLFVIWKKNFYSYPSLASENCHQTKAWSAGPRCPEQHEALWRREAKSLSTAQVTGKGMCGFTAADTHLNRSSSLLSSRNCSQNAWPPFLPTSLAPSSAPPDNAHPLPGHK